MLLNEYDAGTCTYKKMCLEMHRIKYGILTISERIRLRIFHAYNLIPSATGL